MPRYFFDTPVAAATALLVVLKHARTSPDDYTFGPLSVPQLVENGMTLTGNTTAVALLLDVLAGTVAQRTVGH